MDKIIYPIGSFACRYLWFAEDIDGILVESLFIYAVLQVCCAIGLFGIFSKLNSQRGIAIVPGINMVRLGELLGCRFAGFLTALCKIGFIVVAEATVRVYTIPLLNEKVRAYHCGITVLLALAILLVRTGAGYVLYRKLIRRFAENLRWLILFLLFPNISILLFGFNPNIHE